MAIINRLKDLRLQHKLTLKDLAKDLRDKGIFEKITDGTLSRYESGSREPKLDTWKKLADYFGVDVGYLQGVTDVKVLFKDRFKDDDILNITNKVQNKENLTDKEFKLFMNMFTSEKLNDASRIISEVDKAIHPYSNLNSNDFPDLLISDTALQLIELIIDSASINSRDRKKARSKAEIINMFINLFEQLKEFNNE